MLKQLTHVNVWVHDQDEALAFYTEKLGMELRDDVTMPELGNFRWLTVGHPGQPDVALTLIRSGRRDPAAQGVVGCLAWGDAFSARIDDDEALAEPQPYVLNFASWITPSSDTLIWRRITSPQAGAPTSPVPTESSWVSSFPTLSGFS